MMRVEPATASASSPPRVAPGSVGAWVLACRPATLSAAAIPVIAGTACAQAVGAAKLGPALAAGAGALLLQVAANLANDVFDHEKGADTTERLGPTRVVQSGLLSAPAVRRGMLLALAMALGVGVYLTMVAGWPIVVLGLLSIASAVAYTGGPYPLGYHGLGDLFVLVFFGFVAVAGTAYVQALDVPTLAWWASAAVGVLSTAILVVNNVRDRETDAKAGKRTLAVRLGRRGAIGEYYLLLATAYLVPVLLVATGQLGWLGLLPLLCLPEAVRLAVRVTVDRGRPLNASLVGTARLLLIYGLLLSAGVVLGAVEG